MTKNFYVERITVDPEFKEKMIPKLKAFYFTAVLPELASPQAVIREPCQWLTEEWECTYLQLDSCKIIYSTMYIGVHLFSKTIA